MYNVRSVDQLYHPTILCSLNLKFNICVISQDCTNELVQLLVDSLSNRRLWLYILDYANDCATLAQLNRIEFWVKLMLLQLLTKEIVTKVVSNKNRINTCILNFKYSFKSIKIVDAVICRECIMTCVCFVLQVDCTRRHCLVTYRLTTRFCYTAPALVNKWLFLSNNANFKIQ